MNLCFAIFCKVLGDFWGCLEGDSFTQRSSERSSEGVMNSVTKVRMNIFERYNRTMRQVNFP